MDNMDIRDFLLSYFASENYEPLRAKELADRFGLRGEDRIDFYEIIDAMLVDEEIKMTKRGRIKANPQALRPYDSMDGIRVGKADKSAVDSGKRPAKETEKESNFPEFDIAYAAPKNEWMVNGGTVPFDEEIDPFDEDDLPEEKVDPVYDLEAEPVATGKQDLPEESPDFDESLSDQTNNQDQKLVSSLIKGGAQAEEEKGAGPVIGEEESPEVRVKDNEGYLKGHSKGFAFFISDNPKMKDTYIAPEDLNGGLHGDRVRVRFTRKANPDRGFKQEGQVTHILERNQDTIVGTYEKRSGFGFVLPDEKGYFKDIYIDEKKENGAKDKDKVIVKIDRYAKEFANPEGHIVEVLGNQYASGVDITSVARKFDLPYLFSEGNQEEQDQLPDEISAEDRKGRKDLRKKFTVTIDGADAKDFDDAITVEKRGRFYNLYVHIADVSHYVQPGSAIDRDAFDRGNSVYLLDRVIPMLPEKLSNGICSLLPEQDRLTMTTQMTLSQEGDLVDFQFYPSVINSDYRLVYDKVSDYLENGTRFNEDEQLFKELDTMYEIYEMLVEKRHERGTIDFEFPETEVRLDDQGKPVYIGREERRVANRIIEEFMILNNETVGSYFHSKRLPFIYRVHDEPNEEKVERLNRALYAFHYDPVSGQPDPEELRRILLQAKGKKEEDILNMLVLQSMTKAIYSSRPGMHFGLAIDHYSHFTAPIRRYSDIIAHRLMKSLLAGKPVQRTESMMARLDEQCLHISDAEVKAEDAERDVVDMKCAEYMRDYVGSVFTGVISSLTNFGVFVMLENTVEGLAHFRDMTDDYYTYDEEKFVVRGERTKREIRYGDKVEVLVLKSNPEMREIDFQILWEGVAPLPVDRSKSMDRTARSSSTRRARKPNDPGMRPKNWTGGKLSAGNEARKKGESGHRNRLSNKAFRKKSRKGGR